MFNKKRLKELKMWIKIHGLETILLWKEIGKVIIKWKFQKIGRIKERKKKYEWHRINFE